MGTSMLALLVGVCVGVGDVPTPITFNFDDIEVPRFDLAISNYMTDTYGSDISVDGSRTVTDIGGAPDVFIATSIQLLGRGDFVITFEETPIIGAQFEGHIIDPTPDEDFRFTGFAGDVQVFSFTRNTGEEVFNSGWLDFPQPVDRIIVSDSGRRDVGLDDLTVQPAPDPATGLLLLSGLALASSRRRRRSPPPQ